ncbi:Thioredoxin reductase [bacterium AB1]|nr:Thioredoxin reductase [bacterium AB1]
MFNTIIIGAGFSGLSLCLNFEIYKIKYLVIDNFQQNNFYNIINFPSYNNISNTELKEKIINQIKNINNNFNILKDNIYKIIKKKNLYYVYSENGEIYKSSNIVLSYGYQTKKINIDNFDQLYESKHIVNNLNNIDINDNNNIIIIGGGDSAFKNIEYIINSHKNINIFLICRNRALKMQTQYIEQIQQHKNIKIYFLSKIIKIENKVIEIQSKNQNYKINYNYIVNCTGISINTNIKIYVKNKVKNLIIKNNFIKTNKNYMTNIKNLYAIGILSSPQYQQIINCMHTGFVVFENISKQNKNKTTYSYY